MRDKMQQINGILFTGGMIDLYVNGTIANWTLKAQFVFNEAKRLNDKGEYFPLWGTCQGHELLNVLVGGPGVLGKSESWFKAAELTFMRKS